MRRSKVERLRNRGDVAGLTAVLELRDEVVTQGELVDLAAGHRILAVRALAELNGDGAASPGLVRALDDPDATVRRSAAQALAERPDPSSARGLATAVARWPDADPAGRRAAEIALSRIEAPEVAPSLVEAILEAPRDPVDVGPVLEDLIEASDAERVCVDRLIEGLRDERVDVRRRAEVVLGWLGPRPVERLIDAMEEGERREVIAAALGRTRDRRASAALMAVLDETDRGLRRAATKALADIADPRTIDALLQATDDDDYEVRSAAIAAVNELGTVAVIVGVAHSTRNQIGGLEAQIERLGDLMEKTVGQRQLDSGAPPTETVRGVRLLQERLRGRR